MEYITSRGFILPQSGDELANHFWFNLWRTNFWPYRELIVGDILYWYESPSKSIVWKSQVIEVHRFSYNSKNEVRERLRATFGDFNPTQTYFVESPDQGYCLAWKVAPLQRLSLLKPHTLRFPGQGWLRIDHNVASEWLNQPEVPDNVTLDDIAPSGSILQRLDRLNEAMAEVSPERVRLVVVRTVRNDTNMVRALKELCEFRCQFPGCEVRIPKRDGGFYIEVAHIQPVSEGGQSTIGNLIVLCPNHHKELDYGNLNILEQTTEKLRGRLNNKYFEIRIPDTACTHG